MMESRDEPDRGMPDSGATESIREESEPGRGQGYEGGGGPDPEGVQPDTEIEHPESDPTVLPEAGGYAGRDPRTDMPAMPSVPETQDETLSHDAAPDPDAPEETGSDSPSSK